MNTVSLTEDTGCHRYIFWPLKELKEEDNHQVKQNAQFPFYPFVVGGGHRTHSGFRSGK